MDTKKLSRLLWIIAGIIIIFMVLRVMKNQAQKPDNTTIAPIETEAVSSQEAVLPVASESPEEKSSEVKTSEATPSEEKSSVEKSSEAETLPSSEEPATEGSSSEQMVDPQPGIKVTEDGEYTDKEHVAYYIYRFNHLPSNYITKAEAEDMGWVSSKGNLWKVAPGKSIGGSYFGNYEGKLPKAKGRKYYECDIDFDGKYRNAKRLIYSNDGLIYYTNDHYETFELLYDLNKE